MRRVTTPSSKRTPPRRRAPSSATTSRPSSRARTASRCLQRCPTPSTPSLRATLKVSPPTASCLRWRRSRPRGRCAYSPASSAWAALASSPPPSGCDARRASRALPSRPSAARARKSARARARARVPSSRGRGVRAGRWDDIAAVATEMRVVATSSEHQRLEDRGVYANAAGLGGDDGTGEGDGDAHEHTFFMPSRAVLLAMGRSDLVWALQKHGARAVREHAGLAARPRGRPRAKDAREPTRKRGARRASAPQST